MKHDFVDQSSDNSDLVPSDYHVFLHLKKHVGDQRHDGVKKVKMVVLQLLSKPATHFYVEYGENYVENLNLVSVFM